MAREMKIMDLAKLVYELPLGCTVDFVRADLYGIEKDDGWCGVTRIDAFCNNNMMFLIGLYFGEATTRLYAISEYDERIGDFCSSRLCKYRGLAWSKNAENYIECIAKMIADFITDYWGCVGDVVVLESI